jgi:hypothetical protein
MDTAIAASRPVRSISSEARRPRTTTRARRYGVGCRVRSHARDDDHSPVHHPPCSCCASDRAIVAQPGTDRAAIRGGEGPFDPRTGAAPATVARFQRIDGERIFGHKGSLPAQSRTRRGLFQAASGGTLFLDDCRSAIAVCSETAARDSGRPCGRLAASRESTCASCPPRTRTSQEWKGQPAGSRTVRT